MNSELSPECWDHRHVLPHPVYVVLGIEPRTSCMVGKRSVNWSTPQLWHMDFQSYEKNIGLFQITGQFMFPLVMWVSLPNIWHCWYSSLLWFRLSGQECGDFSSGFPGSEWGWAFSQLHWLLDFLFLKYPDARFSVVMVSLMCQNLENIWNYILIIYRKIYMDITSSPVLHAFYLLPALSFVAPLLELHVKLRALPVPAGCSALRYISSPTSFWWVMMTNFSS